MSVWTPPRVAFASKLWKELRSTNEILEALEMKFNVEFGASNFGHLRRRNRDLFPFRTDEQRRAMISKGRLR